MSTATKPRISLLDVNVLVALFDRAHIHHDAAHLWFGDHRDHGWATCPLTENGLVRVISNPGYPGRRTTVTDAVERLRTFTGSAGHTFWPDSISILEPTAVAAQHLHGHRQITDAYLLALAVGNSGRLVTFDASIPLHAVPGATASRLTVLEPTV